MSLFMHNTQHKNSTFVSVFFRDWGIRGALNRLQNSGSYGSRGPFYHVGASFWQNFVCRCYVQNVNRNCAAPKFPQKTICHQKWSFVTAALYAGVASDAGVDQGVA